jgi:hypothetical protein
MRICVAPIETVHGSQCSCSRREGRHGLSPNPGLHSLFRIENPRGSGNGRHLSAHPRAMFKHPGQQPVDLPETSSSPAEIPEQQQSLFQEVLALFEAKRIAYAVSGAFALREHTGICRDTKDLDVFLTAETAVTAMEYLRQQGFVCEVCDPVWLFKTHRDGFFVDLITGMSNAALIVEPTWIERSKPAMVHGVPTRVLAPEELLASKLFVTRRERFDGVDIAHVIYGSRGNLDWQRVLSLVGENWEMLLWALVLFRYCYPAQTYYVPQTLWQTLLTRFQDAISRPDPTAKFRGSLVDPKMFAIDVKEWGFDNLLAEYRSRRLRAIPPSLHGRPGNGTSVTEVE